MDPYISYVPRRREEWRGHTTKRGVHMAIAYDRGRGRLRIFERHTMHGATAVDYCEVPRDAWDELFSD
ncbi:hypothetical protein [Streptomyces sp. CAU 1734]|uniref:hypothetical protein n=1 Tax=Streptomyces sp. CAU 1734 TaxID=3140360 RepID=UPI003260A2D3